MCNGENLCDNCLERELSIERTKEFLKHNPEGGGMICDPTPKAECKWHTIRGYDSNYQKTRCREFIAK